MPSVVRSTFVLGTFVLAAVTATACGDKVTVTQPPKDTSVQSVLVSPPGPVQMKIGDKVTYQPPKGRSMTVEILEAVPYGRA